MKLKGTKKLIVETRSAAVLKLIGGMLTLVALAVDAAATRQARKETAE